jgi:hypothetical protein
VGSDYATFCREAKNALRKHAPRVLGEVRRKGLPEGRWHPYGFAVFKVGDLAEMGSLRLHIWSAGERRGLDDHPPEHEHDWHLAGLVLAGTYTEWFCTFSPRPEGEAEIVSITSQNGVDCFVPTGERGCMSHSAPEQFAVGEIHCVEAGVYHASPIPCSTFVATLALTSEPVQSRRSIIDSANAETRSHRRPIIGARDRGRLLDELTNHLAETDHW